MPLATTPLHFLNLATNRAKKRSVVSGITMPETDGNRILNSILDELAKEEAEDKLEVVEPKVEEVRKTAVARGGRPLKLLQQCPIDTSQITSLPMSIGDYLIYIAEAKGTKVELAAPQLGVNRYTVGIWIKRGEEIVQKVADPDDRLELEDLDGNELAYYEFFVKLERAYSHHAAAIQAERDRAALKGTVRTEKVFREVLVQNKDGSVSTKRVLEKDSTTVVRDGKSSERWLEQQEKKLFPSAKRLELTGEDGKPVEITNPDIPKISDLPIGELEPAQMAALVDAQMSYDRKLKEEREEERRDNEKVVSDVELVE